MGSTSQSAEEARGYNPAPRSRVWRDRVLPRSIVPLFWLACVPLSLAWLAGTGARRRTRGRTPVVAVESGRIGWTQVFFEELLASAEEYAGRDRVRQQVIDRDHPYLPQFRANQRRDNPTHVVLDVRTPGQSWRRSLVEAIAVSWHLLAHGRVPVVVLSDAFYRRQRWHAAVLTVFGGVVLTFAPASVLAPIFPHRRIIGPLPMPISRARVAWLEDVASEVERSVTVVQFIGHLYPPRSTFLDAVDERLTRRGITLSVNGDKWGTSNEAYWRTLAAADIVVTTCMQGPDRPFMDWIWVQQLVFRYAETMAAGAALVASRVEGSDRFFVDGRDFAEFVSVDDAVAAIADLAGDPERRLALAAAGHATAVRLSDEHTFWVLADDALGVSRMRPA